MEALSFTSALNARTSSFMLDNPPIGLGQITLKALFFFLDSTRSLPKIHQQSLLIFWFCTIKKRVLPDEA
jgi:hypothetical protein